MIICQSCAMPLQKDEDFGTNKDGSKNQEYCVYCYANGEFTDPGITMDAMIKKVEGMMKQQNVPEDIINKVKQLIPQLKRWK